MAPPKELRFDSSEAANKFLEEFSSLAIAGVDECGRGPFAGPVVAACVILPKDHSITGIRDSKKLSAKRREFLSEQIMEVAVWGIGARSNEAIDSLNIREATFQAAADAVLQCVHAGNVIDHVLCDGGLFIDNMIPMPSTSIIKGDDWFECISAASIIAKVYRDRQMAAYHDIWPEYGFKSNSGYGTQFHREAIMKYGLTPIHRRTYGLCKEYKGVSNE